MYIQNHNIGTVGNLLTRIESRKRDIEASLGRLERGYGYSVSDLSYEIANDGMINRLYESIECHILGKDCG